MSIYGVAWHNSKRWCMQIVFLQFIEVDKIIFQNIKYYDVQLVQMFIFVLECAPFAFDPMKLFCEEWNENLINPLNG